MDNTPNSPRSRAVLWFFIIVVALTVALGIVATFRTAPRPAPAAR